MNLAETILQAADNYRDSTALIYRDRSLTYGELSGQVRRAACALADLGVGPGDTVLLVMRNCPEFVVAYLALARIGAVAVPLNPAASPTEMASAAQGCSAAGVVAQARFIETVTEACSGGSLRFTVVADGPCANPDQIPFELLLARDVFAELPPGPGDDDLAALLFTSGVTGQSKAVMLTHGNIRSNAESCVKVFRSSAEDRYLAVLPMFHSFCWTVCVMMPMLAGSSVVIAESVQPFSELIATVARHGVSVFVGVPAIFAALNKAPGLTHEKLGGRLSWCLSGAAPLPLAVQEEFQKRFGVPLLQGYGLTEASPVLTTNPTRGLRKLGTIGPSIPDVSVEIRDGDGGVLGCGEVGELVARGPNVMRGYLNDPGATRAAFTDDGWLRTGDLGYCDEDGHIHLVDRAKDLVIVKGLNVYPREVEDILLEHASVADAAVIGIPNASGDETLQAYVTLKEGSGADPSELRALFHGRLAPYKIPKTVVILDEMPRNALGKTLKRVLREQAASVSVGSQS